MYDPADARVVAGPTDRRKGLAPFVFSAAIATGALLLAATASAQDADGPWFTEEQATRGNTVFTIECGGCHGYSLAQVLEDSETAETFYSYISNNMPWENPGSLAPQQYADIVAFFLGELGFPAGYAELPPDRDVMAQIVPANAEVEAPAPSDDAAPPEAPDETREDSDDADELQPQDNVPFEKEAEGEVSEEAAAADSGGGDEGFYTAEQAEQGRRDFAIACGGCHGGEMVEVFQGYSTAAEYYRFISTAMPADDPGNLAPNQYVAIMAYLLGESGFPEGDTELTNDMDLLEQIIPGQASEN